MPWFEPARDWTSFVVSLTALVTSVFALRSTLLGPQPFIAAPGGDVVTILRSSEFRTGASGVPAQPLILQDETGAANEFPLILFQPVIGNGAPEAEVTIVRRIRGVLTVQQGSTVRFRSEYEWFRITESTSVPGANGRPELVFSSAVQISPFALPGGGAWSRELLMIPYTTKEAAWSELLRALDDGCRQAGSPCLGQFDLTVEFAGKDETSRLEKRCAFEFGPHQLTGLSGERNQFFTSPECRPSAAQTSGFPPWLRDMLK
jgi:hypothetical protein